MHALRFMYCWIRYVHWQVSTPHCLLPLLSVPLLFFWGVGGDLLFKVFIGIYYDILFCFMFWFLGQEAYGILPPRSRIKPGVLALKAKSQQLDHQRSPIRFQGLFFFFGSHHMACGIWFSTRDVTQDLGTESLSLTTTTGNLLLLSPLSIPIF